MKKDRILCAMSGGIDSSVASMLLKKKGYEVIGIFMNFWSDCDHANNQNNRCCSPESLFRARLVAQKLGIKLFTLNLREVFKKKVVDYYIASYENGNTPNPCVVCNQHIKFGRLLEIARGLKINKIATGHYAKISKKGDKLFRGVDSKRDQSYFLWRIDHSSLPCIEFPVGNLLKKRVREIAAKHDLVANISKESRGVCFVGSSNISFLKKHAKKLLDPGDVVDKSGKFIGKHRGLAFYTIGQRGGFETTHDKWRQRGEDVPPLYVKGFDLRKNQLIVDLEKNIYQEELLLDNINWLSSEAKKNTESQNGLRCTAQIRYLHQDRPCLVKGTKSALKIIFDQPQRAITPGQSCVLYQDNLVLGGGIIRK